MRILLIIFAAVFLAGCASDTYKSISAEDTQEMLKDSSVKIIDVRTPEEFASGHIPEAELMPLQNFDELLFEFDKEKTYIIVCRSGNRSAEASALLSRNELNGYIICQAECSPGILN
ncbi:rhodanese-like domain-containing protein [Mesobacillus harenae]|uniref:rhodanese-like domain-containing protein n=1 Tax=Mesobacillus harenae TaxID=2213203 RepID=UPI001580C070|nr:rhodanese-like domain-containing protein [Mesobacillus harenae]